MEKKKRFRPRADTKVLIYREEEEGESDSFTLIADGRVLFVNTEEPRFRVAYEFNKKAREDDFYTDEIQPPLNERHLYLGF
jgi:hypothetical protein